jgi:stearoyl-CoA desaturase (Delta-9 desaturase)
MARTDEISWGTSIIIVAIHLLVLIGLPVYLFFQTPSIGLIIGTIALFFACGLSITAGYHRLFAHRAYEAKGPFKALVLFFGTIALQGSVAFWTHTHRLHHQFTDKEKDPHNITKGFFYAHMGWLFHKQPRIDPAIIPDIVNDKLCAFQHRNYYWLAIALNALMVAIFAAAFNDVWGAIVFAFGVRAIVIHHATWFINSLAHTWGSRIFSREHSAVNNAIVAIFTMGEGYHNYHHVFPSDYRNGVRWYQYDPTKWLIWIGERLGMVKNLKKIDDYTSLRTAIAEDERVFSAALKESVLQNKEEYEQKVKSVCEYLKSKLTELKSKHTNLKTLAVEKKKEEMRVQEEDMRRLKQEFKKEWASWVSLTKELMGIPEFKDLLVHHHHY